MYHFVELTHWSGAAPRMCASIGISWRLYNFREAQGVLDKFGWIWYDVLFLHRPTFAHICMFS